MTMIIIWGIIGGMLAEFVKWYNLRESNNFPIYAKSIFYLVLTDGMILIGGLLVYIYKVEPDRILLAVNIGASAPLIIKSLAGTIPSQGDNGRELPPGKSEPSMWDFLAGR